MQVWPELSPRERQIVRQVDLGRSNRQIAEAFDLAVGTVKIHLHHIFTKVGVSSRTELMVRLRKRQAKAAKLKTQQTQKVEVTVDDERQHDHR